MILDYGEDALKEQLLEKGLDQAVVDQRLLDFKTKTLPAAKHFDDKFQLHLVILSSVSVLTNTYLLRPRMEKHKLDVIQSPR